MGAFLTIFFSVFLAELGDKTQLATLLFAADGGRSKIMVFAAAAGALVASTVIAVLVGAAADRFLGALPLKLIAGAGFIIIGGFMIAEHFMKAS
jgi:putative Ca2+/H+ antiporter (TMEM165/GDT1 family)